MDPSTTNNRIFPFNSGLVLAPRRAGRQPPRERQRLGRPRLGRRWRVACQGGRGLTFSFDKI